MTRQIHFQQRHTHAVHTAMTLIPEDEAVIARVAKTEKFDQDDANTYVRIDEIDFHNGIIELDVCGKLLPNAPAHSRGFIGIVFRANETNSEFESFYIRPANGRDCEDPIRKQHACQYFAFPGYTYSYFREFGIDGCEAPIDDIALGEWSHIKAEIMDDTAKFSVNGRLVLDIQKLKHGAQARGAIGLYVDIGTDGFFKNLTVTSID